MEVPGSETDSEPPRQHQILEPTAPGGGLNPHLRSNLSRCSQILNPLCHGGNASIFKMQWQLLPSWRVSVIQRTMQASAWPIASVQWAFTCQPLGQTIEHICLCHRVALRTVGKHALHKPWDEQVSTRVPMRPVRSPLAGGTFDS